MQVTGNKVAVPWRPEKRQKLELFGQKVGFWGDGAEDKVGGDHDDGDGDSAAALDGEVRRSTEESEKDGRSCLEESLPQPQPRRSAILTEEM